MKTVALRTVALILLVGGVPLILGPPSAQAATSSFTTGTASGVSASATFVTGTNTVAVTLSNTLAASAFTNSAQAISDISFTTSTALSGTPTGSGATGSLINISTTGDVTPAAGTPTRWTDAGSITRSGNTITATVLGGGQPSQMVAPTPGPGPIEFPNVNQGVANFNPYVSGTLSFTVAVTGVTSSTTITSATFSFGTGPETFVPGVPTTTPVPEPSTLAIAGLGTLGFLGYGLRRRLKS